MTCGPAQMTMRALDEDEAPARVSDSRTSAMIVAVAQALADAASRLDNAVGEVTGALLSNPASVDAKLVTRFQDFDRLNQEFVALADVLGEIGRVPHLDGLDHSVTLARVTVSDLRQRLLAHVEPDADGPADLSQVPVEVEF